MGLLFLGDSITQGWERHPEIWNANFGAYAPANFGIGSDRTQHVLWRITHGALEGIAPRAVVILIGTNNTATNTAEEIASGIGRIVDTVREKLPEATVVLMAVFPRGPRTSASGRVDDAAARMALIGELNQRLATMDDGNRVRYLDIGHRFLAPDGTIPDTLMPDQLHLSAEGYRVWADGLTPVLAEIFGGADSASAP